MNEYKILLFSLTGSCAQRNIRIYDSPLLIRSVEQRRIEARPENPQEQGAYHRKNIRVIRGALVLSSCILFLGWSQHGTDGQSKVGTESVHNDRTARIGDLKQSNCKDTV